MKILVAADISPNAIAIATFLKTWLTDRQVRSQVTILHITEPELHYTESAPSYESHPESHGEAELQEIFHSLESLCDLEYAIVTESFGEAILSRAQNVDTIVMGRRKRDQVQEVLLGSLSQFVLHRANCPVLIVPEMRSTVLEQVESLAPAISGEALARLKVLISVAKADGNLSELEKAQLRYSVRILPPGITWDALFDESIDLTAELAQITSLGEQELTYYTAYRLVAAKTTTHPAEEQAIDRIQAAFSLDAVTVDRVRSLVNQSYTIQGLNPIQPIAEPKQRATVIDQKLLHGAISTAVLGAFPFPLLSTYTESAALSIQFALIVEIGNLWGYTDLDAKELFEEIVGSLGLVSAWLTAIDLAKLLPRLGSDLAANDAFTATWAIGKTMNAYCDSDRQLNSTTLRQLFKQFRKDGDEIYRQNEWAIAEQQSVHQIYIKTHTEDLKAKKLSLDVYKQQIQQRLLLVQSAELATSR